MRFIKSGDQYDLYDDSVMSFESLPVGAYTVEFDQRRGCYLMEHAPLEIQEMVYGVQQDKIKKVMNAFERFERSLGVILSGDKGIGKTMFAKKLCMSAIESGLPIIIVEEFHQGLVRFIERIEQECVVLFDEFDKSFTADNDDCEDYDDCDSSEKEGQARLLSLFDGTSGGKKLFVVTCNDLRGLNNCLLNRPGRFHYHFRFGYPTAGEIEEYMTDKLEARYHSEISKIVTFSRRARLNYDCLRAIAFEINGGSDFAEAIADLNIINTDNEEYDVTLNLKNGQSLHHIRYSTNLFDGSYEWITLYDDAGKCAAEAKFNKSALKYDEDNDVFVIERNGFYLDLDEIDERYEGIKPVNLVFARVNGKNIHYFV